jgi:hypothetical protein
MKNAGGLVVVGILGIAVVVFLLTRNNSKTQGSYQGEWHRVEPPLPLASPSALYENEERWEVKRGPDRLIEEIVVHRKVTANA